MKSVFISDLHLSESNLEIYQAFKTFLNHLSEDVDSLFILGDLFEAWIGDDDSSDFAASVKNILYGVSARGIDVRVQQGNRDFMLSGGFERDTGSNLLPDYYVFENYGQKALLMHGDLLCTDDHDYQRFRKRVRQPLIQFILRSLPLSRRKKIASKWRQQSQELNKNKPENIMDVNADAVIETMARFGVDTLIHGHTHRPDVHLLGTGKKRMVLGDWDENLWWIEASAQGFELFSNPVLNPASTKSETY